MEEVLDNLYVTTPRAEGESGREQPGLKTEHSRELSRYAAAFSAGTGRPTKAAWRSVLFETSLGLPRPRLFRPKPLGVVAPDHYGVFADLEFTDPFCLVV